MPNANPNYLLPGENVSAMQRRLRFRDSATGETHIHVHMPTGIATHTKPKPSLDERVRQHIRTRNAMPGTEPPPTQRKKFATDEEGYEEGNTGGQNEQVVGQLPPPDEGMTYRVQEEADGSWTVVLVPDDGSGDIDPVNGNATLGDRTMRHVLSYADGDPALKRMNARHRRFWSGDAKTRDKEQLIFRHTPASWERMELRRKPDGSVDVVLISPDEPTVSGMSPLGSGGNFPKIDSGSSKPGATGDGGLRPGSMAHSLRQQNVRAREFWRRK